MGRHYAADAGAQRTVGPRQRSSGNHDGGGGYSNILSHLAIAIKFSSKIL